MATPAAPPALIVSTRPLPDGTHEREVSTVAEAWAVAPSLGLTETAYHAREWSVYESRRDYEESLD